MSMDHQPHRTRDKTTTPTSDLAVMTSSIASSTSMPRCSATTSQPSWT